ncbi:MAG: iron ABC transporter permease [Pseudomonadota bacterium]
MLLVALPLVFLIQSWDTVDVNLWNHLLATQMSRLLFNSFVLACGVSIGVGILGFTLAWITTTFQFPGRRIFEWTLVLPFAIPAYVSAFVWTGLTDYSGFASTTLRTYLGFNEGIPSVRSLGGAIIIFTFAFYPYVFLMVRAALISQGEHIFEAARSLGESPRRFMWTVALPMVRPALLLGITLAVMETLADFGAVSVLGVNTFTTAIYKAWYGFFSLQTAAQLASLLVLVIFIILLFEYSARGRRIKQGMAAGRQPLHRISLYGIRAGLATGICFLVTLLGVIIPITQLMMWASRMFAEVWDARWSALIFKSLLLAGVGAFLVILCATAVAVVARFDRSRFTQFFVRFSLLGYALPGSILAVGTMLLFISLDHKLYELGIARSVVLGSLGALMLAYVVRFLVVGFGPVETALSRIRPHILEAGRALGVRRIPLFFSVILPMMVPGISIGMLLVFVDLLKEMPATLLLRPLGWDTLALKVYEYTSEGEWQRAAVPGLLLVAVGLLPVIWLVKRSGLGKK